MLLKYYQKQVKQTTDEGSKSDDLKTFLHWDDREKLEID